MPSKKKKFNSRFPPARIKKIMQSDEEVGKVAQVVPIIISKALEIFVASLLKSSSDVTRSRNARTLTPNHIKASILSNDQFLFLRELAQTIPDVNPGAEADEDESAGTTTANNINTMTNTSQASATYQRKVAENRTKTSTTTGQQMSAAGQIATTGFRTRGRPRKRPIESLESQISVQSTQSIVADEEDEDTEEEEEEDEEVDEEEECQPFNNNQNLNNSSQEVVNNNNQNPNINHFYGVIRPPIAPNIESTASCSVGPSVITTQQSMSGSFVLPKPAIDEDDDYDN